LTVALASAVPAAGGSAQDDPAPSPSCLQLGRIDRTEVVDTGNILFYLKDRAIYQNALPHACATLADDKPFLYRVTMNQICDSDVITVLERWTFGFTPTEACVLGDFKLVDKADVEALKAAAKAVKTGTSK
jgi:hypothetical protein